MSLPANGSRRAGNMPMPGHNRTNSQQINQRAQLVNAYQELGKELNSEKLKVVGGYTLSRVIGEGSFGAVYLATHRLTSTRVAIKKIPKSMTGQLTREIHHHRSLHHKHILQLYEIIATETHIWLVSELCTGGELFDYLVERGRLLEGEARRVFGELTVAVGMMHNRGTVHRDLKLENVFLDGLCGVKLGDLGFAREWVRGGNKLLETFCGTTGYAAPEMLRGVKYSGEEVDIWSLGIILYTLLCGGLPFDDDDEDVMKSLIIQGDFEEPEWLSEEAKDLIKSILQLEPSKRPSIDGILSHPWFTKGIVDPPIDAVPGVDGSVTPFLHTPEIGMSSYFSDAAVAASMGNGNGGGNASTSMSTGKGGSRSSAPLSTGVSPFGSPRIGSPRPSSPAGRRAPTSRLATESVTVTDSEGGTLESSLTSDADADNTSITTPTTVDGEDVFISGSGSDTEQASTPLGYQQSNESQTTIKKPDESSLSRQSSASDRVPSKSRVQVMEEQKEEEDEDLDRVDSRRHSSMSTIFDEYGYHLPLANHSRTPARTKRRSVSSSVASERRPSLIQAHSFSGHTIPIVDYLGQTREVAPEYFTTRAEKELLTSLELLGFDVGQLKHSVLSNACDASAALWWMLRSKQQQKEELERYMAENLSQSVTADSSLSAPASFSSATKPVVKIDGVEGDVFGGTGDKSLPTKPADSKEGPRLGRQIELGAPISEDKARRPSISPEVRAATTLGVTTLAGANGYGGTQQSDRSETSRSAPNMADPNSPRTSPPLATPTSFETIKPPENESPGLGIPGNKRVDANKGRSTSISMLQRATSALSTGLTRKKSDEKLLEESATKDNSEQNRKSPARKMMTPPMGWLKDSIGDSEKSKSGSSLASASDAPRDTSPTIPPSSSFGTISSASGMSTSDSPSKGNGKTNSLLMTFRSWWGEDRRKRKRDTGVYVPGHHPVHGPTLTHTPNMRSQHHVPVKRGTVVQRRSPADARPYVGSRRSSSVNSRRSSITSLQLPPLDLPIGSPMDPYTLMRRRSSSRRSTGSRTPTSEFGDFGAGSRPSSVRSMQMAGSTSSKARDRHHKAGSFDSVGSSRTPTRSPAGRAHHHHRGPSASGSRNRTPRLGPHHRTASSTTVSSIRSAGSSRRSSHAIDERAVESENESIGDDASTHSRRKRSVDDRIAHPSVLIARKQKSPLSSHFSATGHAHGRVRPPTIRDVFAKKDKEKHEDDWTSDEDESGPCFAGGLGQGSSSVSTKNASQDSPAFKTAGAYPTSFRGSGRAPKPAPEPVKSKSAAPSLEPVAEPRGAARGRGAMAISRPADITEEEEPEE